MKNRRILKTICFAMTMTLSLSLFGCGSKASTSTSGANSNSSSAAGAETPVTIKYWTWYPSADQLKPAIDAFQKKYPNIKVELSAMESTAFQQKMPVALSTGEEIDVVGVQAGAMGSQISTSLAELQPLMDKYAGSDWTSKYSPSDLEASKAQTGGTLKALSLVKSGSMIGYYNAKMLKDMGLTVPKTIDEYATFAAAVKAKDKNILPAVYAGKEAWVNDEMMLTVMGQTSDYYNQWRYKKASVDDSHFISALGDFKQFFDKGIFSKDIMDLDYGKASEMFTTGKAATYFMGSWEMGNIAESVRKANKVNLEDVGAFGLPTVEAGGKVSARGYVDTLTAVVKASKHQKEATEFISFMTIGEGMDILGKNFVGVPSKANFKVDDSMLTTQAAKDGWKTMSDLIANPTADRNNVSGYSDIEGASVQKIILGLSTPQAEAKALQKEWTSGKYSIK